MNVVVVTMAGLVPSDSLGDLPDHVRVRSLTAASGTGDHFESLRIALPAGPFSRLVEKLSTLCERSTFLRMLLRVSPFDRGARFWRAVRDDRRIDDFIRDVDLLVAGDRDANFTCWHLARRVKVAAVSGFAAGRQVILREAGE